MSKNIIVSGKKFLGKVAYSGKAKNCPAYLTWELQEDEKGRVEFSMCGEVWNHIRSDIYMGGQCCDEVVKMAGGDAQARRMVEIWQAWHLNGMNAGNREQRAYLAAHGGAKGYTEDVALLEAAGLNNDYKYGSAWLYEEIPAEIIEEIKAW